ncbi:acyl-coenzyme A thioesterase 13 isoform X1 [Capsicum galapagoense]
MAENVESKNTVISEKLSADSISKMNGLLNSVGVFNFDFPDQYETKDSFSELTRGFLKVQHIHPGKISCIISVKPPILNVYGSLHGGAVGAVAERVAIACARTIVGKDKELFLGELSISYLSGTTQNAEVIVNASIVRSGRNLTVVAMDFRLKDSEKLSYISRATFYHMPVASL